MIPPILYGWARRGNQGATRGGEFTTPEFSLLVLRVMELEIVAGTYDCMIKGFSIDAITPEEKVSKFSIV